MISIELPVEVVPETVAHHERDILAWLVLRSGELVPFGQCDTLNVGPAAAIAYWSRTCHDDWDAEEAEFQTPWTGRSRRPITRVRLIPGDTFGLTYTLWFQYRWIGQAKLSVR